MFKNISASFFVLGALVGVTNATGATFIVPEDRALVAKAKAIVVATVVDTHPGVSSSGFPVTVAALAVDEVIKGAMAPGETIELTELGGRRGELAFVVPGSPRYTPGEKVLAFLDRNARGGWSTLDLALGRFVFESDHRGQRLLLRDEKGIVGWDTRGRAWHERARRADEFLRFVRAAAKGRPADENYFAESAELTTDGETSSGTAEAGSYPASAYASTLTMSGITRPVRWSSFGSGVVLYNRGTQPGYSDGGIGAIKAAVDAWTGDAYSNIVYLYGGATSATSGLNQYDNVNSIQLNDPNGEISGTFNGSGTLGIGGYWSGGATHSFNGETFYSIIQVDIVIQDGVGNYLNANKFAQLITHESGHTLGLRHSDQGTPGTTAAIMRSSLVTEYGSTLQPYDRDAIQTMYGSGAAAGTTFTASAITPSHGAASGTSIAITGSGFQAGAKVTVGGYAAYNVAVSSDGKKITAVTPSLTGGTVAAVVVRNPDGATSTVPTLFFANFLDVAESHPQRAYIESLARHRITAGCGGGNFCPSSNVTRAQMSIFILRAKYSGSFVPAKASGNVFSDIPVSAFAADWIERLAAEKITAGCGGKLFCPDASTTRAQMMVFLVRAKYGSSYTPPAPTGIYADVPVTNMYAPFVEQAARAGFVSGCGGSYFCPDREVTRAEKAELIVRTFSLPLT